jgi:hypothetical protein
LDHGQVKEAAVKQFHYDSHDQFKAHLNDFMEAYNFGRMFKTLNDLTRYEYTSKIWSSEPEKCIIDPVHQTTGLGSGLIL